MAVDDRVTAHVALELAKAKDRLAHLEALEKEVPVLSGTSNRRLLLSRKVNNARNLASGWARVAALLEMDQVAEKRETIQVHPAPERTVAWESNRGILVCNTSRQCRQFYGPHLDWFSRTASDLGESGQERNETNCAECGTDVLA